jgi:cation transporter-like permease
LGPTAAAGRILLASCTSGELMLEARTGAIIALPELVGPGGRWGSTTSKAWRTHMHAGTFTANRRTPRIALRCMTLPREWLPIVRRRSLATGTVPERP